jgi:hypothetical protein
MFYFISHPEGSDVDLLDFTLCNIVPIASSSLKMEAVSSSKTLVNVPNISRRVSSYQLRYILKFMDGLGFSLSAERIQSSPVMIQGTKNYNSLEKGPS